MAPTYGHISVKATVRERKEHVSAEGRGYVKSNSEKIARSFSSGLVNDVDRALQVAYDGHKRKR